MERKEKTPVKPKIILFAGLSTTAVAILLLLYVVQNPNNKTQVESQNTANEQVLPGIPVLLSIPSINVEAKIEPAGLAADGTVGVPKGPYDVTWYKLGAKPGEVGSAVVTGHYGTWRNGAKSVFDNLNQLKPGDEVSVQDEKGNWYIFTVKESKTYGLNETVPEVFTRSDKPYLNVITCSGEWLQNQKTFTQRLVVFTELKD